MDTATLIRRPLAERYPDDPTKRWEVTRRAMRLYLRYVSEVDSFRATEWRQELANLPAALDESDYVNRMDTVRRVALDEWVGRAGSNCTEGTNRFLMTFGLDPVDCSEREYEECDEDDCETCHPESTKEITVTVTVTFRVTNSADEDTTEDDVRDYLRVDVRADNVDDVDGSVDVSVDDVDVQEV